MSTQVIIVRSHDNGDLYCAVSPSDPLNPQFTVDEIRKRLPDAIIELVLVSTLSDFIEHDNDMNELTYDDVYGGRSYE